jgi:hypothetical protein
MKKHDLPPTGLEESIVPGDVDLAAARGARLGGWFVRVNAKNCYGSDFAAKIRPLLA